MSNLEKLEELCAKHDWYYQYAPHKQWCAGRDSWYEIERSLALLKSVGEGEAAIEVIKKYKPVEG